MQFSKFNWNLVKGNFFITCHGKPASGKTVIGNSLLQHIPFNKVLTLDSTKFENNTEIYKQLHIFFQEIKESFKTNSWIRTLIWLDGCDLSEGMSIKSIRKEIQEILKYNTSVFWSSQYMPDSSLESLQNIADYVIFNPREYSWNVHDSTRKWYTFDKNDIMSGKKRKVSNEVEMDDEVIENKIVKDETVKDNMNITESSEYNDLRTLLIERLKEFYKNTLVIQDVCPIIWYHGGQQGYLVQTNRSKPPIFRHYNDFIKIHFGSSYNGIDYLLSR